VHCGVLTQGVSDYVRGKCAVKLMRVSVSDQVSGIGDVIAQSVSDQVRGIGDIIAQGVSDQVSGIGEVIAQGVSE
jgi:hypothetical protein